MVSASAKSSQAPRLKGVIFDLDGTLIDSRLDFDEMRREIGIPDDRPVLEYVESLPEGERKQECYQILMRHEFKGAREATLFPGILELMRRLASRELRKGILTRNLIAPTLLALDRLLPGHFSEIITREDAPPKPDPEGLFRICRSWNCHPSEVIFIGDYLFDVQAGKNAAIKTVLYLSDGDTPHYASDADYVARCFLEFEKNFDSILAELGFWTSTH